jgi:hypothetical protein
MASVLPPITSDEASGAMVNGLTNLIRDRLRERIMERLQPDIDAAVEQAMGTFKTTIESYHEPHNMQSLIRVLIVDRRSSAQTSAHSENPK